MNRKPLVVLTGPTASGKSSLAIELCSALNGEIVSADSMQIYKHMNIGTAKAMPDEWKEIPHHLTDFLEPDAMFSVAEYAALAKTTIDEIHDRGKLPFLVGGTGLYINAVIDNIQFFDLDNNWELRKKLEIYASDYGNEALWRKLQQVDPELAENLHPNNKGRIIRGLEVFETSGEPLSLWQKRSVETPSPYQKLLLGLSYDDRQVLYNRINTRVDEMLENGLLKELENLLEKGFSKTAKQAIGYKELFPVLENEEPLEIASNRLKQSTRRYAKRQLTWMRGRDDLQWVLRDKYKNDKELIHTVTNEINDWLIS